MWRSVLLSCFAVIPMTVGAKESPCEAADAPIDLIAVESQSERSGDPLGRWMTAQSRSKNLSLVVLKRKPEFLSNGMPCASDDLLFDSDSSVLTLTRRCRAKSGQLIAYTYSFVVCEQRDVPVATRSISRLMDVDLGAFRVVSRRVAYEAGDRALNLGGADTFRAKRAVREGAVLSSGNLEFKPLVARKQAITIRSIGSGFRLELPGVALMDGWAGDVVRVRSKVNGNVLDGIVESSGVVRVDG